MRWFALIALWLLALQPAFALAKNPPASARSRSIISRQRVVLDKSLAARGFHWGAHLFVRIFKEEKTLELWLNTRKGFRLHKTYPICTYGGKGLGPKTRQGDGRAPEGFYFVTPEQMNPFSRYHLAFNLGYPNAYDRQHSRTGAALMVHGRCVSIGCFAMTDAAIEEIYTFAEAAMRSGQPFFRVHIFPFRMTDANMRRHRLSKWLDFWRNLRDGYDWFERHNGMPPDVRVNAGRYVFAATPAPR